MRIALVAGARPNFVKIAPLAAAVRAFPGLDPFVVHTGQHYDDAMSAAFFRDLEMPEPDRNLGVGSGSHAYRPRASWSGSTRCSTRSALTSLSSWGT